MKKFLEWLKVPSAIVAALAALMVIASSMGIGVELPGDKISAIEQHQMVQDAAIMAHDDRFEAEALAADSAEAVKDFSRQQRTQLIEKLVVGECLESTFEKLGQQQLIETCRELGVARSAGDAIDIELRNQN